MIKNAFKSVLAWILGLLARLVLRRYKPRIVMVTGSVGKTSTKDAVAAVLAAKYFVRKSEKSYNTELGVPFTILGAKNPWGNPFAWLGVFKNALALTLLPNHYPNLLVLEVGADRPGDLKKILRFVTPDAVVVTRLPEIPVHVEAYASPEAVREEEFSPAFALAPAAPLIVSADDPYAHSMAVRTAARVISYGLDKSAHVHLSRLDFSTEHKTVVGMRARVAVGEEEEALMVAGSVGKTQLLPAAAALATASAFGIELPEALEALAAYEPPAGRGRLFAGKHGSVLIDDTYNSSPAAVEEALATLAAFPHAKRRIAVLGDMLELGRYSVMEHERTGALAKELADVVISVGVRARRISEAAVAAGLPESAVRAYDDSHAAAAALPELVGEGDIVLIKGSQSIRMERITEALLADLADASRLVRQEREWKRRS